MTIRQEDVARWLKRTYTDHDFDTTANYLYNLSDPVVGVLSDGVVQSVKILATEQTFYIYERPAFNGALKSLAGHDLGNKVGAWKQFWHENGKRLLEERETRYAKLANERRAARRAADGE